jgi:thiol-disulfide isomerase/thioredoxin
MKSPVDLLVTLLLIVSPAFLEAMDGVVLLNGQGLDPLAGPSGVSVLIFVRTDCPLSNRYAPELNRLYRKFAGHGAKFFIVYADPGESREAIYRHLREFRFPGIALRDPAHTLVRRAKATVTPEAAVFSRRGELVYHGRIDNRFVELGKSLQAPTRHDLEEAIEAALNGRPPDEPTTPAIGCYLADVQ